MARRYFYSPREGYDIAILTSPSLVMQLVTLLLLLISASLAAAQTSLCAQGQYSDGSGTAAACHDCPAGSYGTSTSIPIPLHLSPLLTIYIAYAPWSVATSCTLCPVRTYSTAPGSTSCTPCAAGYATDKGNNPGAVYCYMCGAGFFSVPDDSQCCICCGGWYSSAGATQCTQCPSECGVWGRVVLLDFELNLLRYVR